MSARTNILTGRAILMALCPLRIPLGVLLSDRNCWYCTYGYCELLGTAPTSTAGSSQHVYCSVLLRRPYGSPSSGSQPRRPSRSPARLGTPLPGPPSTRARSPTPLLRYLALQLLQLPTNFALLVLHLLIHTHSRYRSVAAPDTCGPPGSEADPVAELHQPGFRTPQPCRPANFHSSPASLCLAGTSRLLAT